MKVYDYAVGLSNFYRDLYKIVDDPSLDPIISWSQSNRSFVICNLQYLIHSEILSRLNCRKLSDFIVKLEKYGFVRMRRNLEQLEFGNYKYFVSGKPKLLNKLYIKTMSRKIEKTLKEKEAGAQLGEALQLLRI